MHGGSTKTARAAGQRRWQESTALQAAERALARQRQRDPTLATVDPAEHLERVLLQAAYRHELTAAAIEQIERKSGALTGSSGDPTITSGRYGDPSMHPIYALHEKAAELHLKAAVECKKAGIQERRTQLVEGQAKLIAGLMRSIITDPDAQLSAPVQERVLKVAAKHLRALPAGA